MNKYLIIGAIVLVVLAGGYYMYRSGGTASYNKDNFAIQNNESGESDAKTAYSLAQIAEHATYKDCWFAIEGKVYDVTKFIEGGKHGGGVTIIDGCGKDATALFNTRPMGSGTPHSDTARSFLPNFYIGDLAKQ